MNNETTGRAGVAPSREEKDRRRAQRPDEDTVAVHCAGCGAPLPVGERCPECGGALPCLTHYALKTRDDLRCDLCWRSLLAAEAAYWREGQTDTFGLLQGAEHHDQ